MRYPEQESPIAKKPDDSAGATLLELLLPVVMIGILAAIAIPKFMISSRVSQTLEFPESKFTQECIQKSAAAVLTEENFNITTDWDEWESGGMLETDPRRWQNHFVQGSYAEEVSLNAVFRRKKGAYGLHMQAMDRYQPEKGSASRVFDRDGADRLRTALSLWGKQITALSETCTVRREMPQMKFRDPPVKSDVVKSAVAGTLRENGYTLQEPAFDDLGRFATHPKITKGLLPDSDAETISIGGIVLSIGRSTVVIMSAEGDYRPRNARISDPLSRWPETQRGQLAELRDRLVRGVNAKVLLLAKSKKIK